MILLILCERKLEFAWNLISSMKASDTMQFELFDSL